MSSISGNSIDWTQWEPISARNNNPAVNTEEIAQVATNPVVQGQVEETAGDQFVVSQSGETCTDGNDDGKISLWSKIGNTIKGIGKGAVNMVKSAIKHPIKTALMVGACCIPVVGPAIAIGLGAYGVYQGGKTIVNGIKAANAATTDAAAKEAWQNVGNGTFTTAASALAIKGGASVLKGQLTGGSATVTGIKNGTLKGAKAIGKSVVKETGSNIQAVGKGIKDTGKEGIAKAKQGYEYVKSNGVKGTAKNLADKGLSQVQKGADYVSNKASTLKENIQSAKSTPKIKTEAQYKELRNYIKQQEQAGTITHEAAQRAAADLSNNFHGKTIKTSSRAIKLGDGTKLSFLQKLGIKLNFLKPSNVLKSVKTTSSNVINKANTIIDTKLPISDEVLMYSSVLDSEG